MFRTEDRQIARNSLTLADVRLAQRVIEVSDRIRKELAAKKDPKVGAPQIYINPTKFTPAPVGQAEEMTLTLQVSNQGKGTLDYRLVPDCGCFVLGRYQSTLAPGETTVVSIMINTYEFLGKLSKVLYVYSNDPEFPIKRIPLETIVRHAYRFVNKTEGPVLYAEGSGATFETILVLDDSQDFNIKSVTVNGVSAIVEHSPWTGELDYPEIGEGVKERKGFLIRAVLSPNVPEGRTPMQIQVETDDDVFRSLVTTINVQKGIVSVPLSLYFGQIGKEPARTWVVLTRPGRPFKILKVESDTDFIVPSFEPGRDGAEYRVIASYAGDGPIGRFVGRITVHTDDPKQSVIKLVVEGTVR
jgi:hypothetical protein